VEANNDLENCEGNDLHCRHKNEKEGKSPLSISIQTSFFC
jgi:hypothetical protein